MANFISPCGGLYFDDSSVKKIGNVITGASVDSATNSFNFCGQSYDSAVFEERNSINGLVKVLSSVNNPDELGIVPTNTISFPCGGVLADSRFFQVQNGAVGFKNGFVLTINATPSDATITVTLSGENVAPMNVGGNQFLMESLGETYVWKVEKDGYTTQTGNVVASDNSVKNITLVKANILTVNVTPTDSNIAVTLNSNPVSPIEGTANTFYMNESGAEYTVVCSKTGYVNNSQNITNNASDQTIDVVLNLA